MWDENDELLYIYNHVVNIDIAGLLRRHWLFQSYEIDSNDIVRIIWMLKERYDKDVYQEGQAYVDECHVWFKAGFSKYIYIINVYTNVVHVYEAS